MKYKLSVVDWFDRNGNNVSQTAREFSVDRKRVREWVSLEDTLMLHRRGSEALKKRLGRC